MKRKRILSLLLALTVMATMLMAVPLTGYAAEDAYAEFVFDSTYNTSIGGSNTTATVTYSSGLSTNPVLTTSNTGKTYSATSVTSYTATLPYSGKSQTWSKASKGSASNGFILTSNLSSNTGYGSYDVTIIYTSHGSSNSVCTVTDNSTGETKGTATSGSTTDYQTLKLTYQTSDALKIIWTTYQPRLYYIGVKYNKADPTVSFDESSITLFNGSETANTKTLNLTTLYLDGAELSVTSDDESVAEVSYDDETGTVTVTAVGVGETTINASATVSETEYSDSCTVKVIEGEPVTNISVSGSKSQYVGTTNQLTATVTPENATNTGVDWSSSVETVATVDENGLVTAVAAGTTIITVAAQDGSGVSGSITITVSAAPKVSPSMYSGTVSDLETAPMIGTTSYDLVKTADDIGAVVGQDSYDGAGLYFNDQVYLKMEMYTKTKSDALDLDGNTYDHAYRLKGYQYYVAVKLAPGATVSTYVNYGGKGGMYVLNSEPTTNDMPGDVEKASASDATVFDENKILTSQEGYGVLSYTNGDDETAVVYITALGNTGTVSKYYNGGDSYITQIRVTAPDPNYTFDDIEYDSGKYEGADGQTYGVIRFLQAFTTDEDVDVTGYGFYFVNGVTGDILTSKNTKRTVGTLSGKGGFYGDLIDIPENNLSDEFYAIPFVTYGSVVKQGTTSSAATVKDVTVDDYPATSTGETVTLYYNNGTSDSTISGGNSNTNNDTWTFVDGVDETVKSLIASSNDNTVIDNTKVVKYLNYIGGTGNSSSSAARPTISVDLQPGTYTLYYLGYNSDKQFWATDDNGNVFYTEESGTNLASNGSKTMKYYTMNITLNEAYSGNLKFSTTNQWLPDLYEIIISGTTAE